MTLCISKYGYDGERVVAHQTANQKWGLIDRFEWAGQLRFYPNVLEERNAQIKSLSSATAENIHKLELVWLFHSWNVCSTQKSWLLANFTSEHNADEFTGNDLFSWVKIKYKCCGTNCYLKCCMAIELVVLAFVTLWIDMILSASSNFDHLQCALPSKSTRWWRWAPPAHKRLV